MAEESVSFLLPDGVTKVSKDFVETCWQEVGCPELKTKEDVGAFMDYVLSQATPEGE